MQPIPEDLESILLDLPWNQTESCSFAHRQHINILETKMIQRELTDLVHRSSKPLRSVLLVDSRAAAGAWSKGRSSARNLNRVLRKALGWTLAGRKTIHIVWVRSSANPSDHPSRKKRIPEPPLEPHKLTKKVFGKHLDSFRTRKSNRDIWRYVEKQGSDHVSAPAVDDQSDGGSEKEAKPHSSQFSVSAKDQDDRSHPARPMWSFKEIFSGSGHLTRHFKNKNFFKVKPEFELIRRGHADPLQDILDDHVFSRLCREASHGKQLWHFGFPCGSFSIMQNMNKGTRTVARPEGDGALRREKEGNEILHRVIHLCLLLHAHGSFFTLENPLSSHAWKMPAMVALLKKTEARCVDLDQCMYKLMLPDANGKLGFSLKPTRFCGTMPNLEQLRLRCNQTHSHVAVIGGIKYQGKWQKRSVLAGAYPERLCRRYHDAFAAMFM